MASTSALQRTGLLNYSCESYANQAMGVVRRVPTSYCLSDRCCSFYSMSNVKQKDGSYKLKNVLKRKPKVVVYNPDRVDNCPECGKSLVWILE